MSTSVKTIFLSEIFIVLFMVLGFVPQEFSYLILILLGASFAKLSLMDALRLFIISMPFFVAFPANRFSDSMSEWRILIIIITGRIFFEIIKEQASRNHHWKMADIFKIKRPERCNYCLLLNLFVLFLAVNVISLLFAQYMGAGIRKISFIINIILLFPVTLYAIRKEEDAISLLKHAFYASFMAVLVGYFQFLMTFFISLSKFWEFWTNNVIKVFYGQGLSELLSYSNTWFSYYEVLPPTLRMFSVFPDSHSFPMFVLISMPAVLAFIFYYKDKRKNIYVISLIMFLLSIYLSGSRGVWVSSVFALFSSFALFSFPRIKKDIWHRIVNSSNSKINSKMIIFSIVLFFMLFPVSSFVLTRNQEVQLARSGIGMVDDKENAMFKRVISISDLSEMSNKGRLQIWAESTAFIQKHPLLGIGPGNFPLVLAQDLSASKKGSSAHNIYLDVAVETGVFGLILFVLIIFEILKRSRKLFYELKDGYAKIFSGAFFVYFSWISFYGLFDVVILNDKVLMFMVIMTGILYSLENLKREG